MVNNTFENIELGGICFFRSPAAPNHFYYYAAVPALASHEDGTPQLNWIKEISTLVLTCSWSIPTKAQNPLLGIAALLTQIDDKASLSQAQIHATTAKVELLDAEGNYHFIDSPSTTSGYPPFNASFNVRLNERQAAVVEAALSVGDPIPLRITYQGTLQWEISEEASCAVVGDATQALRTLREGGMSLSRGRFRVFLSDCKTQLDVELAEGRLYKLTSNSENADEALKKQVENKAMKSTAETLKIMAEDLGLDLSEALKKTELKAEPDNVYSHKISRVESRSVEVRAELREYSNNVK